MGQAIARRLNADQSDEQGPYLPCECGAGPLRPPPDVEVRDLAVNEAVMEVGP